MEPSKWLEAGLLALFTLFIDFTCFLVAVRSPNNRKYQTVIEQYTELSTVLSEIWIYLLTPPLTPVRT